MGVRKLNRSDLSAILAIEQSVHAVPWTKETFLVCLESGCPGWVLELGEQGIMGFVMVSNRNEECHILNICVAKVAQRQGYGRALLEEALACSRREGAGIAYLEVRRSNDRAIQIYKASGFQQIGERKGYYPGGEDALVFAKALTMY